MMNFKIPDYIPNLSNYVEFKDLKSLSDRFEQKIDKLTIKVEEEIEKMNKRITNYQYKEDNSDILKETNKGQLPINLEVDNFPDLYYQVMKNNNQDVVMSNDYKLNNTSINVKDIKEFNKLLEEISSKGSLISNIEYTYYQNFNPKYSLVSLISIDSDIPFYCLMLFEHVNTIDDEEGIKTDIFLKRIGVNSIATPTEYVKELVDQFLG